MSTYSIKDVTSSSDRYKLYTFVCEPMEVEQSIAFLKSERIPVINLGKEIARFIQTLEDHSYINLEIFEYIKRLLDEQKVKLNISGNYVIAEQHDHQPNQDKRRIHDIPELALNQMA